MKKKIIHILIVFIIVNTMGLIPFNNYIYNSLREDSFKKGKTKYESGDSLETDKIHFLRNEDTSNSGDAIVIESNGHFALIDAASPSTDNTSTVNSKNHETFNVSKGSGKTAAQYMQSIGVESLDFVIGTHNHSDHIGGMPDICRAGDLVNSNTLYIYKDYYLPNATSSERSWYNDDYCNLAVECMTNNNAKTINLRDETNLTDEKISYYFGNIDSNARFIKNDEDDLYDCVEFNFENFNIKLYNFHIRSTEHENTNSIVVLITKGIEKILLTGDLDIYNNTEQNMTNYIGKVDLYKAGHHGHDLSSNVESLSYLDPSIVVLNTAQDCNTLKRFAVANAYLRDRGTLMYKTGESTVKKALVAIVEEDSISMKTYDNNGNLNTNATAISEKPDSGWIKDRVDYGTADQADLNYIWFYIKSDKTLQKGWAKLDFDGDKDWYYFNDLGIMEKGFVEVDGRWYYLYPKGDSNYNSGEMVKGWQQISINGENKWFFFNETKTEEDPEGAMLTGWQQLSYNGKTNWYYFKEYTDENDLIGTMLTGWQVIKGSAYYMNSSGVYEKMDKTAPTIEIKESISDSDLLLNTYSVSANGDNKKSIDLKLNIQDSECGVGEVKAKLDFSPNQPDDEWQDIGNVNTLRLENLSPDTYYLHIKAIDRGGNTSYATTKAITIIPVVKIETEKPSNIQINTDGIVTWDESNNATGYEISFDGDNWIDATNGGNYLNKIVDYTGTKTVYLRAVNSDTENYTSPSETISTNVIVNHLKLTLGDGINSVTGAGNYIKGKTVNIDATVKEGYLWDKWTKASGTSLPNTDDKSTTITLLGNTTLKASAYLPQLEVDFSNCVAKQENNNYYVFNNVNDTILTLKNKIITNGTIKVYLNNEEITDENTTIRTGMKMDISFATNEENQRIMNVTLIVNGDVNGDGIIDINDILQLNKQRLDKIDLQYIYRLAGDVNKDNIIDIKDILQVNKFRLGKIEEL